MTKPLTFHSSLLSPELSDMSDRLISDQVTYIVHLLYIAVITVHYIFKEYFSLSTSTFSTLMMHHFTSLNNDKIFMELFYYYNILYSYMPPTSSHLLPLQVQNYNINSWLLVDEDGDSKLRLESTDCKCNHSKSVLLAGQTTVIGNEMYISTSTFIFFDLKLNK